MKKTSSNREINNIITINNKIQNTLVYPPRAKELELEAKIKVQVTINEQGKIISLRFIQKAKFDDFNEEVLKKIYQWKFPAQNIIYNLNLNFNFQIK